MSDQMRLHCCDDISGKLKAAELHVDEVRKHYEAKITAIVAEYKNAKIVMKFYDFKELVF